MTPKIKGLHPYADGSGAPCTVEVDGYVFALDHLGPAGVTCNLISGPQGHVAKSRGLRAVADARGAYWTALRALVGREWFEANREMYK